MVLFTVQSPTGLVRIQGVDTMGLTCALHTTRAYIECPIKYDISSVR